LYFFLDEKVPKNQGFMPIWTVLSLGFRSATQAVRMKAEG
jgi:hypothetical protein